MSSLSHYPAILAAHLEIVRTILEYSDRYSVERPKKAILEYLRLSSMFAKIPQRLASPFALLGDEAKLAFRGPGGISKLTSTRVCLRYVVLMKIIDYTSQNIPDGDTYWSQVRKQYSIRIHVY